jgi:Zn-dependent protease
MNVDPNVAMKIILALLVAIPVHEFAHALSAVNNGDDGPRRDGRLSIMPWDHFDPVGAVFCVLSAVFGIGIGWGKPVMVNPSYLRNQKWGMCKIAAWGPFSNFLLAIGFALPLRLGWMDPSSSMASVFAWCTLINLGLMLFNLIPVGPLDGAKIVVAFLPDSQAYSFTRFMDQYGFLLLFGLLFFGQALLIPLVSIPRDQLMSLMVGPFWYFLL